jgi:hypothetical protein
MADKQRKKDRKKPWASEHMYNLSKATFFMFKMLNIETPVMKTCYSLFGFTLKVKQSRKSCRCLLVLHQIFSIIALFCILTHLITTINFGVLNITFFVEEIMFDL